MEFMHTHGALQGLIAAHIDSHRTNGVDWPASATHCVVVEYKCWPTDWGDSHVQFFDSALDLDRWEVKTRQWAQLEDNCVRYAVYEWDWGPQHVRDEAHYG